MALPAYLYGDPARIIEAQQLREKGCSVCVHSVQGFGLSVCGKGMKFPACKHDRKNGYRLTREAGG
jgi:hypothetical protein